MNLAEAPRNKDRRGFLRGSLAAGAVTAGTAMLADSRLFAQSPSSLTAGDVAILKFAAAAEIIEADLWQQYAELGGITNTPTNTYQLAFQNLDPDGNQYITSNALDEASHQAFLNAYLISKDQEPVDFDRFRNLPSSGADGANQNLGRLTNLTQLNIDTSWYTRYRSKKNPDFGATFPQALPALFATKFPAIPVTNNDFSPANRIQAIAAAAAFHFGMIEQGGSSLYPTLAQKVTNLEVLRIMLSIGGDEICHFLEWVDFSGNAVQPPVAPFQDPVSLLVFPNFDATPNPSLQTNLIFPVPCEFISPNLPLCSVIRPTGPGQIDAQAAVQSFVSSGLLTGQPREFIELLRDMASEADAAKRVCD